MGLLQEGARPRRRPEAERHCLLALRAAATALCLSAASAQCVVSIAGPVNVEGAPALAMQLASPWGVTTDAAGGLFFTDTSSVIRRVFSNGTMFMAAGTFHAGGYTGDGFSATLGRVNNVAQLSSDGAGGIYLADRANNAIRRVWPNGTLSTLAGVAGGSGTTGGCVLWVPRG